MDAILYTVIIGIACVVIGAGIYWFKKSGYDTKAEEVYKKYQYIFTFAGVLVKSIDEQLYKEMQEALDKMKEAYESGTVTPSELEEIIKECEDVYERVQELLDKSKESEKTVETPTITESETE